MLFIHFWVIKVNNEIQLCLTAIARLDLS